MRGIAEFGGNSGHMTLATFVGAVCSRERPVFAVLAASVLLWLAAPAHAASLQVAPVGLEILAPGAASTVKLHNQSASPINTQVRVFRWVQVDGQEKLEPTDDVVASPPMARLTAGADYTIRVVRVSKQPIEAEESYRLLIDELPDQKIQSNRVINLILRYSIPVFFRPADAEAAKLTWSIEQRNGKVQVSAANDGDRHVRLAGLAIRDRNGAGVSFGSGLTGYVLGHSRMHWVAPAATRKLALDSSVVISAIGDSGPIHASPARSPP
jgi:fimbrial chaperone protein